MSFLHGVETVQVDNAGRSFTVIKSGVIGLIGIAPIGPINQPVLTLSEKDFAQFGKQVPGFTIPQALAVIADQGVATVIVINVFDPVAHTTAVASEAKTVVNGALALAYAPLGVVTIANADNSASTLVLGTDYTIDDFGNIKILNNSVANGTVLKFSYSRLNIAAVNSAAIIGNIDGTTLARTGTKAFELAYNLLGFNPKILIAPGFSTLNPVAIELIVLAAKYRAIAYLDAPAGTTVTAALAGRGPAGTINFNTSSQRTEPLFPQLKKYDPATDADVVFPYSAFKAGVRAAVDQNEGFWVSDSNHEIICEGVELAISASLNDPQAETNLLNAAGITTVFNVYGSGLRTWGNRNASYPSGSGPKTFTNIIRIDDVVSESMELSALPYVDKPITQAFIDTVREDGNSFIRTLIGAGALLPGSRVIYNPDDNTAAELANGHVVFERVYMGPTPAERITFKSIMDITLLNNLK